MTKLHALTVHTLMFAGSTVSSTGRRLVTYPMWGSWRRRRRSTAHTTRLSRSPLRSAAAGPVLRIRDPGSGAFLTPGSGMGKRNNFFGLKYLNSLIRIRYLNSLMRIRIREPEIFLTLKPGSVIRDRGSGMEKIRIRDKHLGFATLRIF